MLGSPHGSFKNSVFVYILEMIIQIIGSMITMAKTQKNRKINIFPAEPHQCFDFIRIPPYSSPVCETFIWISDSMSVITKMIMA